MLNLLLVKCTGQSSLFYFPSVCSRHITYIQFAKYMDHIWAKEFSGIRLHFLYKLSLGHRKWKSVFQTRPQVTFGRTREREREGWTKGGSARGGTCEIKGERILEKQKVKKGKAIVACMTWLAPAKYILIKHELRPMRGGAGGRGRWGYTRVNRPHLIFRLCTAQMLRDLHEPRSII